MVRNKFIKKSNKTRIILVLALLIITSFKGNCQKFDSGTNNDFEISNYKIYKGTIPFTLDILQTKLNYFSLKEIVSTDNKMIDFEGIDNFKISKNDIGIDSIFYSDKRVCIKDLYLENKGYYQNDIDVEMQYPIMLVNSFKFSIGKRYYLFLLTAFNLNINHVSSRMGGVLFDITNSFEIKKISFDIPHYLSEKCFGDFNNDGILDFIEIKDGCIVSVYLLNGVKFEICKEVLLDLKCDNLDKDEQYYLCYLNLEKSKWYFDLKLAWNKIAFIDNKNKWKFR